MKLCSKYRIHLISDEIYAVSVYDVPDKNAVDFISVLSFDHTPYISPEYCHVVYGGSTHIVSDRHCTELNFPMIRIEQGSYSERMSPGMYFVAQQRVRACPDLIHPVPLVRRTIRVLRNQIIGERTMAGRISAAGTESTN